MFSLPSLERVRGLIFGLVAASSLVAAGPCDLYSSGGTPCIAAHSTTRALSRAYSGSLYQVKRGSDNTTTIISPLSAGGVANAAAQDSFCASTTCLITIIYDQSGHGNHLRQAPPGGFSGPESNGYDNLASAIGAPVTLNGQKAYGVFSSPGTGYSNNAPSGTATGDAAEGMYAVIDGTHYNGGCCYAYGNAETNSHDTGNGHMEAIYYGDSTAWGSGAGSGPWIMVCSLVLVLVTTLATHQSPTGSLLQLLKGSQIIGLSAVPMLHQERWRRTIAAYAPIAAYAQACLATTR